MGWLFRFLVLRIVRLYYAPIKVANNRLEGSDPATILVLNHPNGALDPALVLVATGQPVTFLAKSTPFGFAPSRWAFNQFGALPVFRAIDIGLHGGARDREDMNRRNEVTFARCRALLRTGKMVALFPEGTSHAEPMMMPMRTGAARIALSAAESLNWEAPLVVPVGLWYENMTRFRSKALLVPGKAVDLAPYRTRYEQAPRKAVQELTEDIEAGLQAVVLEAETRELLKSAPFIAAWTEPEDVKPDMAKRQARAAELLAGYRKLHEINPDRLAKIERATRDYARTLYSFGVKDPWKLEDPRPVTGYITRRALLLLAWLPLALVGALFSYVPYRLSAHLVRHRFPENRSQAGALKLGVGTLLVVLTWIVEAVVVGVLAGAPIGIALAVLLPSCSYIAIRWSEVSRKVRAVIRAGWLRRRRKGLVQSLIAQRHALARQIQDALTDLHAQV